MSAVPRSHLVRFAQLAALWGYAVSQPVFSFLEGNEEFLVLREPGLAETIAFAVLLAFGLPLVVVGYAALAGLVSKWVGDVLYLAALVAFGVPCAFQVVKPLEPGQASTLLLVGALCAIAVVCYLRWTAVRMFLTISLVLPVAGLAWFLQGLPGMTEEAEAAAVGVASPHPVVVVVLDELPESSLLTRDGAIDAVRYPGFGRLARDATWYANATTVHQTTTWAVPAILTGQMPRADALPTLDDHPQNLFTLLGASYALNAREAMTRLCPRNYCPRAGGSRLDRLEALVEDVRPSYLVKVLPYSISGGGPGKLPNDHFFERAAEGTAGELDAFLDALEPGSPSNSLYFMHLLLPHQPWRYLPSGRRYEMGAGAAGLDLGEIWLDDPFLVQQALQRHLLQVRYTDALLGRVIRRLEQVGLYDRSLLVVVADHGASFRPGLAFRNVGGTRFADSKANFADIARVPLFVKYPGQTGGVVDRRSARTIDILPTIADVLGIRLPWHVDGTSLRGRPPDREDAVVGGSADQFARLPLALVASQNAGLARRNAALFGEGNESMYRLGAHRALIGTRVGGGVTESSAVRVRIEDDASLANVDRTSAIVPVNIEGVVEAGEVDDGTELAIAVNGRVRALTRCYPDAGDQRFRALVPESALRDGYNRVEVYAVETGAAGLRLVRLGGSRGPA